MSLNFLVVFKNVSIIVFLLSTSFLIPAVYSFFQKDGLFMDYLYPFFLSFSFFLLGIQIKEKELGVRESILTVVLVWLLFPLLSTFLYLKTGAIKNFADAFFESVSGFTTTGASILTDIESLPKSVLLWRSTTHFVGGIGFVIFTLTLLPSLGIGGSKLLRFEASKVIEEKIVPKVKEVARAVVVVYLSLTILETISLILCGLNLFDSVNHAFATVSTGGFSTKNESVGAFRSFSVELVISFFMILSSINFLLYYKAFRKRNLKVFLSNYEVRGYLSIIVISTVFTVFILLKSGTYNSFLEAFRYGFFQVVTATSTTGFSSVDYGNWPTSVLALLMILALIGACSGSTAGGLKQFRFLIIVRTAKKEIEKTFNPNLVYRISLGNKVWELSEVNTLLAFIFIYFSTAILFGFIISLSGYDLITSFSSSIACITSLGPGLAKVGPAENFSFFSNVDKILLSFEMILGRLEIFTVLAVLLPSFWRD
jgi:trk system potassium uptake protein TrkH